jgi:hypothetical protein
MFLQKNRQISLKGYRKKQVKLATIFDFNVFDSSAHALSDHLAHTEPHAIALGSLSL